ncbi:MAG: NADPH-dependent FMN reductase [Maritimibacter sp.]
MSPPKLLGIPGSLRKDATNRLMCREAARAFGECDYTEADLNLPLYNGDVEAEGIPASVTLLRDQVLAADAVVFSTPEYNKNLSGVLKNALDWLSRAEGGRAALTGKPVSVMASASGRAGGERAVNSLVLCLTPFHPNLIYGPEMNVAGAENAFQDGRLQDQHALKIMGVLMAKLRAAI